MQSNTADRATPPPAPPRRKRPLLLRLLLVLVGLGIAVVIAAALLVAYALLVATPNLPSLDALTDYRPKVPLRIYTADHVLIGEFGEERRHIVRFDQIPDVMKKAVLAIEDSRFYEHGGADLAGILRAGVANFSKGGAAQGASTITMQVARNFFLSSEKTYTRKLYEIVLAYKIESALTKDQILEVYMNQIYLGERAYGFASAARVYFGRDLKDITVAQAAMLAGLPKAPSAYNPIVNPKRAKIRQEYILQRMRDLSYITPGQYDQAIREPLVIKSWGNEYSVHAEYVAEMVRQIMYAQYREETYSRGFNVVTTIDSADQEAAYHAVRKGVMDYERRRGYRGPEGFIALPDNLDEREQAIDDALLEHPDNGDLIAAIVVDASPREVQVQLIDGRKLSIKGAGLKFGASALSAHAQPAQKIRPGAIVRLQPDKDGNFGISQLPQIESALVSLVPQDGAIRALIGGFDFNKNKFNHATQAWRQPGSSFKPFIYSASLDKGVGPATIINDAPLFFSAAETGGQAWEPKNYGGGVDGPMTMRTALQKSKNLVSIRILNYIGAKYAQQYITHFGFDADKHPAYLPMALGAGLVTPLQMASGYAVFANGGYRVNPYLIAEISDSRGAVVTHAQPVVAEQNAPRAITPRNAYIMQSLLQGVAQRGTGAKSNVLKRSDLGGKTGTTNDSRDAWFAGYQHTLVAITWIGFDNPKSLGDRETGGGLALPIWIDYMQRALQGRPSYTMPMPPDVTNLGGELYYADITPGNGFVSTIGVSAAALAGEASGADAGGAGVNVGENERQDIMNLFKGQ
jgi:penicillin-binding protein 1A